VGKKRLRVEALLAAAASPVPPPACELVPDATLADPDELFPEDLPHLLGLLERADLYLQDEVEVALHPTLTRVWSRSGRAGQRRGQAPGNNAKQYGFGLVDWRDGWLDFELADGRRAPPLCAQLRRAVARSRSRSRIAMVILDNLGIHTPKGSRLLRALLAELGEDLVLVYTPTYDPTPTGSSGCGGPCAVRSPTPTGARPWRSWWPTPTGGPARSARPRCCRRSAARSHPTSSPPSGRNSIMPHELPGSI
jgi:DDE superfamily endonuclease